MECPGFLRVSSFIKTAGRALGIQGRERDWFRCTWNLQISENMQLSYRVINGDKGGTGFWGPDEEHLVHPSNGGKGGVQSEVWKGVL